MRILGIETSCDETSAAVIEGEQKDKHISILSNIVSSSMSLHAKTGGIIPEIAAREQLRYIIPVIDEALKKSQIPPVRSLRFEGQANPPSSLFALRGAGNSQGDKNIQIPNIDAIAVTVGPGLIGSLLVGVETAKTLAWVWKKPIIPVNHLIGHIYANFVGEISNLKSQISKQQIRFPAIALIVSGGHTDLVLLKKHTTITWLSGTRDDAAGEAFDKIGRLLGLPYPAGPVIEKLAANGDPKRFSFPRPLLHEKTLDFSFSGLKTAVLREVQKIESVKKRIDQQTICDISRATQDAIINVLVYKTFKAAEKHNVASILVGGGVGANQTLIEKLRMKSEELKINFFSPPKSLCTDNAAMIAAAAFFQYQETPWEKISANPELYFD